MPRLTVTSSLYRIALSAAFSMTAQSLTMFGFADLQRATMSLSSRPVSPMRPPAMDSRAAAPPP